MSVEEGDESYRRARAIIALSATATLIGIALSVVRSEALGSVVTVGAFAILAWALHRFGRSGPG